MQAIATHLTPEATSYEVARPDRQPTSDIENDTKENAVRNASKLKTFVENGTS